MSDILIVRIIDGNFFIRSPYALRRDYVQDSLKYILHLAKYQDTGRYTIDSLVEMTKERLDRYTDFEKDIIRNNLFGVDLDHQAAEIA